MALLLGGILSLGIAVLGLLLGAAAISSGIIGGEHGERITVASCAVGCLAGGGFAVSRLKNCRLLAGLGTGAVCFLLILSISLFGGGEQGFGGQGLAECAACLCGGALSSFAGKKKKKKGKKVVQRSK